MSNQIARNEYSNYLDVFENTTNGYTPITVRIKTNNGTPFAASTIDLPNNGAYFIFITTTGFGGNGYCVSGYAIPFSISDEVVNFGILLGNVTSCGIANSPVAGPIRVIANPNALGVLVVLEGSSSVEVFWTISIALYSGKLLFL